MKRHIDRFSAILLEMHGTFMFGHDRFGDGEDFHATYRRLGGALLDAAQVEGAIRACLRTLSAVYGDAARHDDCISVREALRRDPAAAPYPRSERALLEEVLACHERGHVPAEYADCLRTLAGNPSPGAREQPLRAQGRLAQGPRRGGRAGSVRGDGVLVRRAQRQTVAADLLESALRTRGRTGCRGPRRETVSIAMLPAPAPRGSRACGSATPRTPTATRQLLMS